MVAAKVGMTGETVTSADSALIADMADSDANAGAAWLSQIWILTLLASASLTKSFLPKQSFPAWLLVPRHEFATSATRISGGSFAEHPVVDINRRRFDHISRRTSLGLMPC